MTDSDSTAINRILTCECCHGTIKGPLNVAAVSGLICLLFLDAERIAKEFASMLNRLSLLSKTRSLLLFQVMRKSSLPIQDQVLLL